MACMFSVTYPNGDTPLVVRRGGYVVTNGQVYADGNNGTHVVVNGDTRFDIQIEAVGSWDY